MKLIIKQYLASLKEREELDAILPDLLSQMGLNVFSRPGRGTRQDGVDVAAVGSLDSGQEKIYLFSIKSGDLTRATWSSGSPQSLRSSVESILDAYIPNRLPKEHKDKQIVICLCFGGDIQEQVRPDVKGFIDRHTSSNLVFEEWNGDKLASLILSNFLREDLLPQNARTQLRKSLALLDEPEASYRHFYKLVELFSRSTFTTEHNRLTVLRQMNICLWILFAWARNGGNIESAYLSSELVLLHSWEISKNFFLKRTKVASAIQSTFQSVLSAYLQISSEFLGNKVLPHVSKRHGLSVAIHASTDLDINLKLFDILSRLSMGGLLSYWCVNRMEGQSELRASLQQEVVKFTDGLKHLISNNPILFLPIRDDQAIDISLALLLLMTDVRNHNDIKLWLSEIINRAYFSHQVQGQYPCILQSYADLLEHPQKQNEDYRQEVTSGSILYPIIALCAGLLGDELLFNQIKNFKEFWLPDESSEEHFYANSDLHGAVLSHVCIEKSMEEYLSQVFGECEQTNYFKTLSSFERGFWPIILIACRHHRLPVPPHFWQGLYLKP